MGTENKPEGRTIFEGPKLFVWCPIELALLDRIPWIKLYIALWPLENTNLVHGTTTEVTETKATAVERMNNYTHQKKGCESQIADTYKMA